MHEQIYFALNLLKKGTLLVAPLIFLYDNDDAMKKLHASGTVFQVIIQIELRGLPVQLLPSPSPLLPFSSPLLLVFPLELVLER